MGNDTSWWMVSRSVTTLLLLPKLAPQLSCAEADPKSTDQSLHVSRKDGGEPVGSGQPRQNSL